VSSNGNG